MPSKINATHLNLSDLVDKWKYTHHINKNTVLKVQLALHFHRKQIISSCCVVVFFFQDCIGWSAYILLEKQHTADALNWLTKRFQNIVVMTGISATKGSNGTPKDS